MKPAVHITFDVECGMGGAWDNPAVRPVPPARGMIGRYGRRQMGVPLITEILRQNGLAATFFLDPFPEEQGHPGQVEPVVECLLDAGQDVQLHVHPCYYYFARNRRGQPVPLTDDMADLTDEQQAEVLGIGCERLRRWTGQAPAAFRAGNMGADERVLRNLASAGIRIDSSYSFTKLGRHCRFNEPQPYNGSKWYGPVLEVALSGFRQPRLPGFRSSKPLDLMGVSFEECREAIESICGAGADAVLILHSFSLFKVRNVQYDGGRLNRIVARRFRRLCRWLAGHADRYPTRTFSDLAQAVSQGRYQARAVPPCRLSSRLRMVLRKAVQAYNRFYRT